MTALSLHDVGVALGDTRAVDGVCARVEHGEWVGVIGPNGAGKTTLLRAIAGLVDFEGEIAIDGTSVRDLPRRALARSVAVVPQIPSMPADATVAEYVLLGRTPYISYFGTERREDVEAAERALARLDLLGLAGRRLGSLSGGERQRAVLARALAQEAPMLLLDEPTTALDAGRQQDALELIDALRAEEQLTVLSAMHDLTLAGQYPERLLMLADGSVVADGAPHEVLTEELVERIYHAHVRVIDGDHGRAVVPVRAR